MPLSEQVVVITGASAGIGRACARAFAARGARLGLIARGREGLEAAAGEARERGVKVLAIRADVSDAAAVEDAADRVERELGPIGTWVNNAMVTVFARVLDMTAEEYRRVTAVTYLGYVHGTLAALRRMHPRGSGTIVQVGSAVAYRSIPLQSAYSGAKAAIRGFTDSLRVELLHERSGVRVTTVQLPAVNTPQFRIQRNKMPRRAQPVPPIFQPELIAEVIVWAAEHAPRELLVGTSATLAVVGDHIAPGLLERYLAATGYESQQTSEQNDPAFEGNLFEPLPGDHGARGAFTERAISWSPQIWLLMHPRVFRAAALAAGAGAAGILMRALRR